VPLDRTLDILAPWRQGGGVPTDAAIEEDVPAVRENDAVTQSLAENTAALKDLEQQLMGVKMR
jgi:hypothetical protein